jgi:hypothetical protein
VHTLDDKLEPKAVRRLELITGAAGGHTYEEKAHARRQIDGSELEDWSSSSFLRSATAAP